MTTRGKLMNTGVLVVMAILALTGVSSAFFFPTGSVQITKPQIVSVSLGGVSTGNSGLFGRGSGAVFRVEPGIAGGKLHLGFRSMFSFMFLPLVSSEVTGSLLRTWGDPWGVPGGETFAGGEFRLGMQYVVLTGGVYKQITGEEEDELQFSFGAGLGL